MALAVDLPQAGEPPAFLSAHSNVLDAALRRLAPPPRSRAGAMCATHMGWRGATGGNGCGKLLRANLVLWAAEAAGGRPDDALDLAVAVEWVHNFTLVHDDIQDGDRTRRGRPALWTVVGQPQAINAGDAMHAHAQRLLTRPGPRPARRLRAAAALSRAVTEVIEGQCLDLALEGRPPGGTAVALRVARAKTGALFGGAMEAGALLGGAGTATAAALRRAGRDLGAAFQVRDDWLGTWGDPALTGKSQTADLDRRKQTYCVAAAWDAASPAQRRELRGLMARPGPEGTPRLRGLLDELGAGHRTAVAARALGEGALQAVEGVQLAPWRRAELADLAAYATARNR